MGVFKGSIYRLSTKPLISVWKEHVNCQLIFKVIEKCRTVLLARRHSCGGFPWVELLHPLHTANLKDSHSHGTKHMCTLNSGHNNTDWLQMSSESKWPNYHSTMIAISLTYYVKEISLGTHCAALKWNSSIVTSIQRKMWKQQRTILGLCTAIYTVLLILCTAVSYGELRQTQKLSFI